MAKITPTVRGTTLVWEDRDGTHTLAVGSPDWFTWLDSAAGFSYRGPAGHFTARKEQRRRAAYWKAYRKVGGRLRRAYLGKTAELIPERLTAAAAALAAEDETRAHAERSAAGAVPHPLPGGSPAQPTDSVGDPRGTVTFLFTDIVDSTQLWERSPQAMPQVLVRHDAIIREAVADHGGTVFKTLGDAACAAFSRAADALGAARDAQRALQAEPWTALGLPTGQPLLVRMAIHTGAAERRDGDYLGPPLNRVARILAAGHGGQILISHATYELVVDGLPHGVGLRDLGTYALRGLSRPEQMFQLISPDLPQVFPPLVPAPPEAADAAFPTAPLLATKLAPPSLRGDLVSRPRLAERLRTSTARRLTLVIAPPGFGKTTLLATWLASLPARQKAKGKGQNDPLSAELLPSTFDLFPSPPAVAWLTLDEGDSDPARFWSYVIAALEQQLPGIGAGALALLHAPRPVPFESVLAALVNAIVEAPEALVLVLDDYHVITSTAIHQALAAFLAYLPPNLHLIVASRADVPLPLARLRAAGQVVEVRAADLRCTPEEASALLRTMLGHDLAPDAVAGLLERTEGWMAGLQLAALSLQGEPDVERRLATIRGDNRYIWDYLVDEVLGRQPLDVQQFLLHTAPLDRMCAELCETVLAACASSPAARGTQAMLEALEAANLFLVPLDAERRWYRYHRLFADVLRMRLRQIHPEREALIHRGAAEWYRRHGIIGEAVQHALAAEDWEIAAEMVETSAEALLLRGEVATLTGWVALLPDDVLHCRPGLTLLVTAGRLLIGQLSEAAAALERVAPALDARRGACGDPTLLAGELATVRALVASGFGDLATAEGWAQAALDVLPPAASFWRLMANLCLSVAYWWRGDLDAVSRWSEQQRTMSLASGNDLMYGVTISTLAYVQFLQGKLRLAAQTCWRGLTVGEHGILPAIAGVTATWLSEITYEWNDLEAAERFARDGIGHGRRVGSVEQQAFSAAQLAKVRQARGDPMAAQALMAEAVRLGATLAQIVEGGYLRVKQVQLWLRQGNLAEASAWAQACDPVESGTMYSLRVSEQLTLARVALAHGPDRAAEAVALLPPLLPDLEERGQVTHLIEASALLALTHDALGDRAAALQALTRALELALPEGYTRLFVDLGGAMATLLEALRAQRSAQSDPIRQECARLLGAFHALAQKRPGGDGAEQVRESAAVEPLAEPLSPREREVLRLVAAGQSNQTIAETLVIAPSTVKMHLKNIYGKLDAHSRTQAVARGRELGLV